MGNWFNITYHRVTHTRTQSNVSWTSEDIALPYTHFLKTKFSPSLTIHNRQIRNKQKQEHFQIYKKKNVINNKK